MASKLIGELNGKWAILFKAQLTIGALVAPMLITWCVWCTSQIFNVQSQVATFISVGPRYTATQAALDLATLRRDILTEVDSKNPPQWLREDLLDLKSSLSTIKEKLTALERDR
jgi:hypothetical protein